MVAEKSPIMKKATSRLLTISQDEQARELYEARLKEQRDIISREYAARQEGIWLVAKNLLKLNMPTNEIALATGLTEDEIEGVRN